MKYLLNFVFFFSFIVATAQKKDDVYYVKESYLIILSTKNYAEAKKIAVAASIKLKIKLDLRGLKPNSKSGLTFNPNECKENGWDFPAYTSRARSLTGEYISIEYSNALKGFEKGYFVVTTASGKLDKVNATLAKVKKVFPTAYAKQTDVYMGCMH
jgi:hypothetical protein